MSDDDPTKELPDDGRVAEETREKFDPGYALHKQIERLTQAVASLDEKVDARLHDTRPLWEGVNTRLADIGNGIQGLRSQMERGFRQVDKQLEYLAGEIMRLHVNQRDTEDRVDKLEKKIS